MKETETEPIPEGLYKATLKVLEEGTGEYGDYIKFVFEISEGDQKGVTRNVIASKKLSKTTSGKTSRLLELVKALQKTEPKVGESLDLEQLVGKSCQIFVENGKEKDGIVYQTVSKVIPV